jgi:hypothetical protein
MKTVFRRSGWVLEFDIRTERLFDKGRRKAEGSATHIRSVSFSELPNRHIPCTYPYHVLFPKSRRLDISECTFRIFHFETEGNFLCSGDISSHSASTSAG